MKQEVVDKHRDNSCGIVGVVFGILSIVFILVPVVGLTLGIIGLVFAFRQNKHSSNSWSKVGLWLGWIGVIVGAVWSIYYIKIVVEATRAAIDYQQLQAVQGTAG
ncbi:MAG: hypothetical protein AABX96_02420 [Nanoarchaeota archaeon]